MPNTLIEQLIQESWEAYLKQYTVYDANSREYSGLLGQFLNEHGIALEPHQKLVLSPQLQKDNGKYLIIIVANRTYEVNGQQYPNCYSDSVWYTVDPMKDEITVKRAPVLADASIIKGTAFEQMPSIKYKESYIPIILYPAST